MSQLVLDDQLDVQKIVPALKSWITLVRLQDLRPGEHILDERIPQVLLTLRGATFVTIDHGFWKRHWCHSGYCILYFDVAKNQQELLPRLLRRLFRLEPFRTRRARMGKVARVRDQGVTYWVANKRRSLKLPDV
jgi:hypothetical protein